MKIRIWGTMSECEAAREYYLALGEQENVKSVEVSRPYANRDSVNVYRVYVTVEYYDDGEADVPIGGNQNGANPRTSGTRARYNARAALTSAGKAVRRGSK